MNIFKRFFNNFGAKVTCILIAAGLWIFVGIGSTRSATFPGDVPLQVKNVPQGLVAVTDIETVKVKVMADSSVFNQLSTESFSVYLDLTGLTEGVHDVKVMAATNLANLQIIETNPAQVVVRLEPAIEKELPVAVMLTGQAGSGLVGGNTSSSPDKVKVFGARSVVNDLLNATAKVDLENQTADFQKIVPLSGLDAKGKEIKNLTFTPKSTTVNVAVVKASNVKVVGIKPNFSGTPADGYWLSKIETEPTTVTVTAAENFIAQVNYVETDVININGLNKNTTLEMTLKPQNGVVILDKVEKVTVKVYISKGQASKEMEVGFSWQNLFGNLKVTSVDPNRVKVVVSGPQDVLNNLTSDDISITVDLSDKNAAGTYSIDLSRSNISGPSGVSIGSIVPSAINVQLGN